MKKRIILLYIFLILSAGFVMPGCGFLTGTDITDLEIYPPDSRVVAGYSRQYDLTATFKDFDKEDVTQQASWRSADPSIADVNSRGVVTGKQPGRTVIEADYLGVTGTIDVQVRKAELERIQVSPVNPNLVKGARLQFTATGIFSDGSNQNITPQVTWDSDEPDIATVRDIEEAKGMVIVKDSGITRITASLDGKTGSSTLNSEWTNLESIRISPVNRVSAPGYTTRLKATGVYNNKKTQDLTDQVKWSARDSSVATISNREGSEGTVTAEGRGETVITASLENIVGSTMFRVTDADLESIQITPVDREKPVGLHEQFHARGIFSDGRNQDITADVFWSVDNPDPKSPIAVISNRKGSEGRVRAVKPGIVNIVVTVPGAGLFGGDKKASMRFTVK